MPLLDSCFNCILLYELAGSRVQQFYFLGKLSGDAGDGCHFFQGNF
jgi:hypothetical protein